MQFVNAKYKVLEQNSGYVYDYDAVDQANYNPAPEEYVTTLQPEAVLLSIRAKH